MAGPIHQVKDHLYGSSQPFAAEFSTTAKIEVDRTIFHPFQPLSDERNLSLTCDADGDTELQLTGHAIWNSGKTPLEGNWDKYELRIHIVPTSYAPAFLGKPVGNLFETESEFTIAFDRITGKVQFFQENEQLEALSGVCNEEVFFSLVLGALECAANQQDEALNSTGLNILREQLSMNIRSAKSSLAQLRLCTEAGMAARERSLMHISPD